MTHQFTGPPMVKIDGDRIRRIRESKGLTQLYVATVVEVTTDTISRWENRRYPSIKQENGLKLAEALEVTLDDILEKNPVETTTVAESNTMTTGVSPKGRRYLPALLVLLALGLLTFWWPKNGQHPPEVTANRLLPSHIPAGQPFPVIVTISPNQTEPLSLILSESLPQGCTVIAGQPPLTAAGKGNGVIKWLSRLEGRKVFFAYLVQTTPAAAERSPLRFDGTVTLKTKSRSTIAVQGPSSIAIAPYHWADSNRDNSIDDEEILTVYDQYEAVEPLDTSWELIDDIWTGQGYRWDPETGEFIVLP